jgi:D-lactate dehydrogenase (cytochrome)
MQGTCTGEHGIGLHKMGFLRDEAGEGAVAVMRTIKQALDPLNIMNPGKVFSL